MVRQIHAAEIAAEAVAERLDEAKVDLSVAVADRSAAVTRLAEATARVDEARAAEAAWARDSYIAAAGRPSGLATDPRNGMFGHPGPRVDTASRVLEEARAHQLAAAEILAEATTREAAQQRQVALLKADLTARSAALRRLRTGHDSAITAARKQQEIVDSAMASKYVRDARGDAGDAALKAVAFALTQRGKPYEWGAEGPARYDCSGLVQTAYASAGIELPRTARPQFRATQVVPITALLPGDLLFFATDRKDWNTIHHVGIYLGHGMMVNAPTTGDVVRIAPVWWSEFYAATRVVPGKAATTKPSPTPSPSPSRPSPSNSAPSNSAPSKSAPSKSAPPSASPLPSSSPSASQPQPPSPSPSPSPSRSGSGSPSGSVTPSSSGSASPTPSGSGSPSPSVSPTASPSRS